MLLRTLSALSLLLVTLAGCNRGPTVVGVSGTVTLDGKPLPTGRLTFEPVEGSAGQRRDVPITNGEFALPASEGVLPGMEFKVSIKAFRKTGRKYPSADPALARDEEVQYLPARYNTATELSASISATEAENRLKFDLVSAGR